MGKQMMTIYETQNKICFNWNWEVAISGILSFPLQGIDLGEDTNLFVYFCHDGMGWDGVRIVFYRWDTSEEEQDYLSRLLCGLKAL